MYMTMIGVTAGAALILLALLGMQLRRGTVTNTDGWALTLGATGALLTASGLHLVFFEAIKIPSEAYKAEPFGGLSALFGVLLTVAAIYLWRRGESVLSSPDPAGHLYAVARAPAVLVLGLGLGMIAVTVAAVEHQIFATAPPQEPVFNQISPSVVNAGFSALFALPGIGAVLASAGVWLRAPRLLAVTNVIFGVAGVGWMLTGDLVIYTHIGMNLALLSS